VRKEVREIQALSGTLLLNAIENDSFRSCNNLVAKPAREALKFPRKKDILSKLKNEIHLSLGCRVDF